MPRRLAASAATFVQTTPALDMVSAIPLLSDLVAADAWVHPSSIDLDDKGTAPPSDLTVSKVIIRSTKRAVEEAHELYGRALETAPTHSDALFNSAKVSLRLGHVEAAKSDLRKLFAADPNYAAGYLLEAQLHLADDDESSARASLNRLLALPRASPRLQTTARNLLDSLN